MFKRYEQHFNGKKEEGNDGFKVLDYRKAKIGLLSKHVIESFKLEDMASVALFYDEKTKKIGLKFFKDVEEGDVKLSGTGKVSKTRLFSLNGFLTQFEPPVEPKKGYDVKEATGKNSVVDLVVQL